MGNSPVPEFHLWMGTFYDFTRHVSPVEISKSQKLTYLFSIDIKVKIFSAMSVQKSIGDSYPNIPVASYPGTGRNQTSHNDVFFQAVEIIRFSCY